MVGALRPGGLERPEAGRRPGQEDGSQGAVGLPGSFCSSSCQGGKLQWCAARGLLNTTELGEGAMQCCRGAPAHPTTGQWQGGTGASGRRELPPWAGRGSCESRGRWEGGYLVGTVGGTNQPCSLALCRLVVMATPPSVATPASLHGPRKSVGGLGYGCWVPLACLRVASPGRSNWAAIALCSTLCRRCWRQWAKQERGSSGQASTAGSASWPEALRARPSDPHPPRTRHDRSQGEASA